MFVGLSDNKYYELPDELELSKDISFKLFTNKKKRGKIVVYSGKEWR